MSKGLQDYELRYSLLEKKAFVLVKVVTHFRTLLLILVTINVPYPSVKMMLIQQLREGRWAN